MRRAWIVLAVIGCGGSPSDSGVDASAADAASATDAAPASDAAADAASDAPAAEIDAAPAADAAVAEVRLADVVHDAPGATGSGFGDPARAVNGVRGGGAGNGSLDVFSLGYDDGVDNYLTLAWSGGVLANGPGIDLAVFENPFEAGAGVFMDLAVVELSRDGVTWVALPHDYTGADETSYSDQPSDWAGFAGRTPVLFHEEDNPVDPFDPAAAGGDGFDLDSLPADGGPGDEIRALGARYVRLVTAPSRVNPDTGEPFVRSALSNGADIDGVYGRYVVPP